jgi:CRP/FNR family cyclic AMP-dependent transcriptional regulator
MVPHFRGLSDPDLKAIVLAGQILRYQAGEILFVEDEPCSGMYVLLEGKVYLSRFSPNGREAILAEIKPVIMFNEVAVIDGGSNPVTARAVEDCITWQVGYERFQILINHYPQVGLGLLRVMAQRNRKLILQQGDLSFRTVKARLARLLLELSQNGTIPISRSLDSNRVLAARVATVPEAVSRLMKTFRQEGLISCTRKTITIQDVPSMEAIVEESTQLFS